MDDDSRPNYGISGSGNIKAKVIAVGPNARATYSETSGDTHVSKKEINISNSTGVVVESAIYAERMENCFNTIIEKSSAPNEIRQALEELKKAIGDAVKHTDTDNDTRANLTDDYESLVKEAVKAKPRKEQAMAAGNGLIAAANTISAISGPVIETTRQVLELLGIPLP